jgi:3-hydroxyisobutyrate dehydrogenase-like beta-hydroxyacid dehydrogenase
MERLASMPNPARENIGVIGLGIIGRAVAAHLRRKGFPVFVWNRSPRPVPNFVGSPGELAGLCNYIQIFVSDDEALLHTLEQLSADLTPRHVVLAHSTVAPDSMRAAAEIVERRGARFVEAAFTGSKPAAEKGELVYYVGATDAALREARPILEASSKEIVHIGGIGQASAIKIATNMITAATMQAAAEAIALVQASGVPLEKFVDAMRVNASYSGTLALKLPKILSRDFEPQFSVKHMLKDMQLATQIALSHYLDIGVTVAARDQLFEQTKWGHGDADYSAVARKYLPDASIAPLEDSQTKQQGKQGSQWNEFVVEQTNAAEPNIALTGSEPDNIAETAGLATSEPLLAFAEPASATPAVTTRLRRGFLKQLLSRFSSAQE